MQLKSLLIVLSLSSLLFTACQQETSTNKEAATTQTESKTKTTASTPNKIDPESIPEGTKEVIRGLLNILQHCSKVEYMLYKAGLSFESEGKPEVIRFLGYIDAKIADESKCGSDYDGGVVFKDDEGDIKLEMDFNITGTCNRVVFKLDETRHAYMMNKKGADFFKQVLNNMQQKVQGQ